VVQHLEALFPSGSIKLAVIDMHGGYERAFLDTILATEPDLRTAYQLKEAFRDRYRLTLPERAIRDLPNWYRQVHYRTLFKS
jgi:hypothetical protein